MFKLFFFGIKQEIPNSGIRAFPGSLKVSKKLKEGFLAAAASRAK